MDPLLTYLLFILFPTKWGTLFSAHSASHNALWKVMCNRFPLVKQYIPSFFVDAPMLLHMILFNNSHKIAALKQMHV